MGQVNLKSLQTEFSSKAWCTFEGLEIQSSEVAIDLHIPADLSWFAGHFPDQPVLPGVVQTHWACELGQLFFAVSGFEKVINLKFTNMILPETHLTLFLGYQSEKKSVKFAYKNDTATFSSGSFRFTQG